VLEWAWSDVGFGVVLVINEEPIVIHGLAIVRYDGSSTVYRLACDRDWETVQDAPYSSTDEAKERLPAQYRREPAQWSAS